MDKAVKKVSILNWITSTAKIILAHWALLLKYFYYIEVLDISPMLYAMSQTIIEISFAKYNELYELTKTYDAFTNAMKIARVYHKMESNAIQLQ